MFVKISLILACLLIFANYFWKKSHFWRCLDKMPQPPAYPIIANLLDILKAPADLFITEREKALQYYPLFRLDLLNIATVNLLSPDDIEQVLSDMRHITKSVLYDPLHHWLSTGLLTSTGAKWQSRRKLLTPAFHFSILQEFIEIFSKETKILVKDLENKCHKSFIDVLKPITQFTLASIGETAMGIDVTSLISDKNNYKDAIYKVGQLMTYRTQRPWLSNNFIYSLTSQGKTQKSIIKILHHFSDSVISERKRNFSSSSYATRKRLAMLDLLLKYQSEGANIEELGIREEVDTFMFEGHDTTSIAICLGLMTLANNRQIQDEIYKEIEDILGNEKPTYSNLNNLKYMERCIKEILRLYPSVPFISRVSGSDIKTKSGYTIPKDCMINIAIFDVHRSPHLYPDPEKFDPDRFLPENIQERHPYAYIPFSAGPRNCIGQKFAMLEIKTVLVGILKKFILEPVDTPKDIVFLTDLVLRVQGSIRVKFVPRHGF